MYLAEITILKEDFTEQKTFRLVNARLKVKAEQLVKEYCQTHYPHNHTKFVILDTINNK